MDSVEVLPMVKNILAMRERLRHRELQADPWATVFKT